MALNIFERRASKSTFEKRARYQMCIVEYLHNFKDNKYQKKSPLKRLGSTA